MGWATAGTGGDPSADPDPNDGYGSIWHVWVWNDINGSLDAYDMIGEIYTGTELGSLATISAQVIGVLAEYNRSPFVEDPALPVAPIGRFLSLTKDAEQSLQELKQDLQAALTETLAVLAAEKADVNDMLQKAIAELTEEQTEGQAILQDIKNQATLALQQAQAQANRAMAQAKHDLTSAERNLRAREADEAAEAHRQEDAAERDVANRINSNQATMSLVIADSQALKDQYDLEKSAKIESLENQQLHYTEIFVGTFIKESNEYVLDVLQNELHILALKASFVPVVGTAISNWIERVNATIYFARGRMFEGTMTLAFSFTPVAAGFGKLVGFVGKGLFKAAAFIARPVSKFLKLPAVGKAVAELLPCPVRKIFTGRGCFVYETEVHLDGEGGEKLNVFLVVSALGILILSPMAYELWKKRYGNSLGVGEDLPEEFDPFANSLTNFMPFGELLVKLEELFDKLFPGQSTAKLQPAFAGEGPAVVETDEAARAEVFLEFTKGNSLDTLEEEPPLISRPIANIEAVPMESPVKPKPKPRGSRKKNQPPKWVGRAWAGVTGGIVTLLLALAFLLPSGAPHTKPIGEVKIFDRTESRNPIRSEVGPHLPQPDPKTWKLIHFRLPKPNGGEVEFDLARSPQWIAAADAQPCASVPLSMPEMGVVGLAKIVSIDPCPEPAPGKGPLVTGIFRHHVNRILDIEIDGREKIGTTPNHLWWSEDRQEFVPAEMLKEGEQVHTRLQGTCRITSITPRAGPEVVYNLEVWGEHVYRVGHLGALVHNTYPLGPGLPNVHSATDSLLDHLGLPRLKKALNSDIAHAAERAFQRGVSPDTKSASAGLRSLTKSINQNGLPVGTIADPRRADSILVPFGNGKAVYELTKKGKAILRTVIN